MTLNRGRVTLDGRPVPRARNICNFPRLEDASRLDNAQRLL